MFLFRKLWSVSKIFWNVLKRPPAHISLGVLVFGGFIAGVMFWGGFNTALDLTDTEQFCISCHMMRDNTYQELKETVHWKNNAGVRATCPDCHVPHNWTNKIARKMQASKEVWGAIFGTISTREKFLKKRIILARHEWARFKANGSLECKNCHRYASMDWTKMSTKAVKFMKPAAARNQSCLDCHKGIAHHLPKQKASDMSPALAALVQQASGTDLSSGKTVYPVITIDVFSDKALTKKAGKLFMASPVKVIKQEGDKIQINIIAWHKKKGYGRVLYDDFAINIKDALLTKESAKNKNIIHTGKIKMDPLTGLNWQPVTAIVWTNKRVFLDSINTLWDYAGETFKSNCGVCHAPPAPGHLDANTWPGFFSGMVGFTNMDLPTRALVLKFLQKHSSTFAKKEQNSSNHTVTSK